MSDGDAGTLLEIANESALDRFMDNEPTLRDRFAMAALKGLLANPSVTTRQDRFDTIEDAWQLAISMIQAREGDRVIKDSRPLPKCNCYMRRADGSHTRKCCSTYIRTNTCPMWSDENEAGWRHAQDTRGEK